MGIVVPKGVSVGISPGAGVFPFPTAFSTSILVTLPRGPVPLTLSRGIPSFPASLFARGVARVASPPGAGTSPLKGVMEFSTSFLRIVPPGPEPVIEERSIPYSRATFLAAGTALIWLEVSEGILSDSTGEVRGTAASGSVSLNGSMICGSSIKYFSGTSSPSTVMTATTVRTGTSMFS